MSSSFTILCPSLVSDKKITRGFWMFTTADNGIAIISLVIIQYGRFLLLWFLLVNDGINSLCAKSNLAGPILYAPTWCLNIQHPRIILYWKDRSSKVYVIAHEELFKVTQSKNRIVEVKVVETLLFFLFFSLFTSLYNPLAKG